MEIQPVKAMYDEPFLELYYGKLYTLDLHGKTLEEAKAELIYTLNTIDVFYKGIIVIHGYHKGRVLKDFVRKNFESKYIYKRVNLDAARTILLINLEN